MRKVHEEVTGVSFRLLQSISDGSPLVQQNILGLFLKNSSGSQHWGLRRYG